MTMSCRRRESRTQTLAIRGPMAVYVGLVIGYALVLVKDLLTPDIITATDFTVFWGAWHQILHGQALSLYDEAAQRAVQQTLMHGGYFEGGLMAFLNPPHAALAGVPFGWLADHAGERVALAVWMVINLALVVRLVRLVHETLGLAGARERWAVTLVLLGFYPVFYTVSVGQVSILLAVAAFELLRASER